MIMHSRLYFILFALIMIVTTIGLLFTCNFLKTAINEEKLWLENARTYYIMVESEDIDTKLNDYMLSKYAGVTKSIYVTFPTYNKDTSLADYNNLEASGDEDIIYSRPTDIYVYAYFLGQSLWGHDVLNGDSFTQEDFEKGNKKITIPMSCSSIYESLYTKVEGNTYNIGDSFNLGNEIYEVIGVNFMHAYEIPYLSIVDFSLAESINIVLGKRLGEKQENEYISYLKDHFHTDAVSEPMPLNNRGIKDYIKTYGLVMLIMVIGFFNFSFIYTSILEKRKKQIAIVRICGLSIMRAIVLNILEVLLLASVFFLLSTGIYRILLLYLMSMIGSIFVDSLSIFDGILLYGAYTFVIVAILMPVVIKYNKKQPYSIL